MYVCMYANFLGKKHNGTLSRCIFYQMRDKTVKSRPRILCLILFSFTCIRVSLFY